MKEKIILRPSIWAELDDHLTSNWIEVHGETKSITEGTYHTETPRDSKGIYIAKIVGALDSSPVTIAAAGAQRTLFRNVMDELKVKSG